MHINNPCGDKKPYTSKAQAEKRAANLEKEEGKPLWAYLCACGKWHLTSKKPAKRSYKSKLTGKRNRA